MCPLFELMPCRDPSSHDAQRYHHHLQAGGISPQPWERTGHEDHEEIPPIYDPYPFFLPSGAPHGEVQDVQAYAPKTTFITDHHWMCCQPPAPESNSKPLKLRRLKIRKSRTKRTARMKPGDSGSDSQRPNDSTAPRHAAPMAFPTLFRAKITSGSSNCRSSQVQE